MARAHARIRTSTSGRNNHPSACAIEAVAWKRPMPSKADAGALYSSIRVTVQNTQLHQSASTRASATLATPKGSLPLPGTPGPSSSDHVFQAGHSKAFPSNNPEDGIHAAPKSAFGVPPYWTFTPWCCSHSETDVHHRKGRPRTTSKTM